MQRDTASRLSQLIRRWNSMQDSTLAYMDVVVEDILRAQRYLTGDRRCLGALVLPPGDESLLLDSLALCVLRNYEDKMAGPSNNHSAVLSHMSC